MNALPSIVFGRPSTSFWLGAAFVIIATNVAGAQEAPLPDYGMGVIVPNPITDASRTHIENQVDRARNMPGRKLKKVVFDFNPAGDGDAATPNYGSCLELARYIQKLNENGIRTFAFVHGKTTRHTVLPVLACTELAMTPDAKIGDVAGNEVIPEQDADFYAKLVGRDREAAVRKMIDKNVEIVSGFVGANTIYVDSRKVGQPGPFQDVVVPKPPKIIKAGGEIGLYSMADAMTLQLCRKSVSSRQELAKEINVTFDNVMNDGPIKAVKIDLVGVIDEAFKQKFFGQLRDVRSKNENMVFLILECGGGSAKVAREIADELRELKNDKKEPIRTIAFIPTMPLDLATFIAFGCSEIVMFKGSDPENEATIGDFEQFLPAAAKSGDSSNTPDFIRKNLEQIAEARNYDKLLVDGMIDRDLQIYRVRNLKTGAVEIVSGPEFQADQKGEKKFQNPPISSIKQPGSYRKLNATLARELRIAQNTIDNRDVKEVYSMYGLTEKDVRDAKPSWIDDFAAFLRRMEIVFFLLLIGFVGLFLEIKMPGAMIPGLVSLGCFVLFFWSQAYANGATIYLAIALFVLGLLFLAAEIFILPGFGVMGVSGIMLVLAGIGLATLEKAPSSTEEWTIFGGRLVQYGLSLMGAFVVAATFARYLPNIPYANRLMLVPPNDKPDIDGGMMPLPGAEQAAALLGQVGAATSMLRPAGMAKFGDQYVDVVTEGDFIEPGTAIQVIEVEGTRIVVKKV